MKFNLDHIDVLPLVVLMFFMLLLSMIGFTYELNQVWKWKAEVEQERLSYKRIFTVGMDRMEKVAVLIEFELQDRCK